MDFLSPSVARAPDAVALDDASGSLSHAALNARVENLSQAMVERLPRGGPVALLLENGRGTITALHALARAGRVVAPLSTRLTAFELTAALRTLTPSAMLHEPSTEQLARSAVEGAKASVATFDCNELASHDGRSAAPRTGDPTKILAILWTSGTTGRARGVQLTAGNLTASAEAVGERLGLTAEDRWYLGLSCAHVGGLALVTRAAYFGAAVVTRGPFSAAAFNELVDEGRVTHASLVPTMLLRALEDRGDEAPPPSLRCVLIGGAEASASLVERALAARFPVALTYGLTEACSQVATAPPALVARKPGFAGPPLRGVELRVDTAGEILVRGPTVAAGYVGADEPLADVDGWLHTGDLGELDSEGHLRVTGRRSDRIVSGGVNVDPAEVEAVLRLDADVLDVSVVGLPDADWGEIVASAVVPRPGATPSRARLETLARERLASAKVPRRVVFLSELPRNANGKIDRARLRELLDEGKAGRDR